MKSGVTYGGKVSEFERQSKLSRSWNSIRTRYSLVTAFLLLMALLAFYIGGRIVLVHLVRDTENQVKNIGADITSVAYKNADGVRRLLQGGIEKDGGASLQVDKDVSLVARFTADGRFVSGRCRDSEGAVVELDYEMIAPYETSMAEWCEAAVKKSGGSAASGIMRIAGASHYVALSPVGEGCLLLGTPFESVAFTSQVNESLAGLDIKVTNRKSELRKAKIVSEGTVKRGASKGKGDTGVSPIFSEAIDFYSGGFWEVGENQYEAVYAVRDIAGNTVTMVSVSIPKSFSSVTQTAIGRLAFFVAIVGLVFVLPIFWFQSYVLLSPLTRITRAIADLGEHHRDNDCPRLAWEGKDEFALLAVSVNRMLETISTRAIAVAQSEVRQRALIDAIPDALAVFDRQHRLVTMTKDSSDVNGDIPFVIPGEELSESIVGKEGKKKFDDSLDRVFAGEKVVESISLKLQRAKWDKEEKSVRYFDVRIAKMDEIFSLALIRDITTIVNDHHQLVTVREKLKDGEKRQSLALLAAGIAHDINNILTIIGNTTTATWIDAQDPDEKLAVDTIGDALHRGSEMMRELMEYAGESRINFKRTAPREMILGIEKILRGLLKESVGLEIDVPDDLPDIDCGQNQLFKVFMNIVKNAVEAIGVRPGTIVIKARKCEMTKEALLGYRSSQTLKPCTGVLFTISDNGPGIRQDILNRLFDPYVSSKSLGHGLGLATVSSVIEAHGGGIRVDSVVERGTTFSVFLPESKLPKEDPAAAEAEPADKPSAKPVVGGEVLVVDDEESIRKTASMLLKALSYTPIAAKDSAEALEAVRRHGDKLVAIVLDASLDDIDTVRLAISFRQNAPEVPIVISSGSSDEHIRKLFSEVKIDAILAKPYTLKELKSVLASVR